MRDNTMTETQLDALKRAIARTGKKAIVIIDDEQAQLETATVALKEMGFIVHAFTELSPNAIQMIRNSDGVISDMDFDPLGNTGTANVSGGLLVNMLAQSFNKPIVFCTKLGMEINHGGPIGRWLATVTRDFSDLLSPNFPMMITDFDCVTGIKDWGKAGRVLKDLIESQSK